jgi:hypothetical protein
LGLLAVALVISSRQPSVENAIHKLAEIYQKT